MDGATFDNLAKRLSQARLTRIDAVRGLLASAAVSLTGASLAEETTAKRKAKAGRKKGKKGKHTKKRAQGAAQDTVTLCHKPGTPAQQTLQVPTPAVQGHLGHGDTLGPCGGSTSTTARPGPAACAGVVDGPDPSGQCSHCCQGVCCQLPANQCNPVGLCCAPNCANRECGPDGCGRGGTCGCGAGGTCRRGAVCPPGQACTCPSGRDCNPVSGQCPGPPACGAATGCTGCCDGGTCVPLGQQTPQRCGSNGAPCAGCGVGGVGGVCRSGTCQACSADADCGAGLTCLHGGCFKLCSSTSGECDTGCTDCDCDRTNSHSGPIACVDQAFNVGECSSDADCPAGTVCDADIDDPAGHHLCVRPCPCPA